MDQKFGKYFCIFCKFKCETISEAYNHYKCHMKFTYYCANCDNSKGSLSESAANSRAKQSAKCGVSHGDGSLDSKQDEGMIEMWIERFLSYQNEIVDKSLSDLFATVKLFAGCPVCQCFVEICRALVGDSELSKIRWSHNPSAANEWRHSCSHLRYYPFECYQCETVGRYHKKCDFSEITRHIKDNHAIILRENRSYDSLIKSVSIKKIESYIEHCSTRNKHNQQNRLPINKSPKVVNTSTAVSEVTTHVTPTKRNARSTQLYDASPAKRAKHDSQIEKLPQIVNNKRTGKGKQKKVSITIRLNNSNPTIVKTRGIGADSNDKSNIPKVIISAQNKKTYANNTVIVTEKKSSDAKPNKFDIKFTPTNKTSNISDANKWEKQNHLSGNQIVVKNVEETTSPESPQQTNASLSDNDGSNARELSIYDEEEDEEISMSNVVEMKNVEYFCVFCSEKFSRKELAHRHYQTHIDYYPIMCLLCGEGLADLPSFVSHHSESHPEEMKGRYKKKEQPHVDKWISTFLYSQATIIKAFPPREQCIVCDRVFSREEVSSNRPRRCTINRRIDHLQRHLCYLPYECLLCKQNGAEFFVAYFESKAHSHIKQKHPEIDDDESRWQIFQKTVAIPRLDEFIENYLTPFGITLAFERRPVKKSKQFYEQEDDRNSNLQPIQLNDSSINLNMLFAGDSTATEKANNRSSILNKTKTEAVEYNANNITEFNGNNNSNDSNIVVNVSPHSLLDKSVTFTSEEDKYFCVFCCSGKCLSRTDAYDHYGEHLDYLPVVCKTCGAKFSSADHLMAHHQSNHLSQTNVDYEIIEDQILMKWVNEFLDSQFDDQKAAKSVLKCPCYAKCPVCVRLTPGSDAECELKHCGEHNDLSFSFHIHQHLAYYPYECIVCKRNGKTVRVPNLDTLAVSHIKEHKIENASMYQLCKNFPKTMVIPKLEKLIGDSVHQKRVIDRKYKVENAGELELSEPNSSSSLDADIICTDSASTSTPISKVQHIRIEGGRIINLPPKASMINGENGAAFGSSASIQCLHCHTHFTSRKVLKAHHDHTHPGLTLACYVPPNTISDS